MTFPPQELLTKRSVLFEVRWPHHWFIHHRLLVTLLFPSVFHLLCGDVAICLLHFWNTLRAANSKMCVGWLPICHVLSQKRTCLHFYEMPFKSVTQKEYLMLRASAPNPTRKPTEMSLVYV